MVVEWCVQHRHDVNDVEGHIFGLWDRKSDAKVVVQRKGRTNCPLSWHELVIHDAMMISFWAN
jgi:hypothetical protein